MKVLLTGASGYIGSRLLITLAEAGHAVVALVRSKGRLILSDPLKEKVTVIEGDLLKSESLHSIPRDIEAAYYLVHSMGLQAKGFASLEAESARNFNQALSQTQAKQVIYLSGLSKSKVTSEHMASRQNVENILKQGDIALTILRTGIIIGSGSASFEIIRDLVEKLPLMVAPKWINSKCQPIAIRDVLFYLEGVLGHPDCLGQTFEIGGPDVLTYREILLGFAKLRNLKRLIITLPLLTPYLSSLWLILITSTNFSLARALINSLIVDAVSSDQRIYKILPHKCLSFEEAVKSTFLKIEQHPAVSSWKDALVQGSLESHLTSYISAPKHGCLKNVVKMDASVAKEAVLDRLWKIGGDQGWYYMDWAWVFRGSIDRAYEEVGLRKGRSHPTRLRSGDQLDLWRVLVADRERGYLLLYAEMRLPGEAWLEWKIDGDTKLTSIVQTATFRPKGVLGRLYWYLLWPIHLFIFKGMCRGILLTRIRNYTIRKK